MFKKLNKKLIRLIIFSTLTVISYFCSCRYLFGANNILWSITFILITFVLFHFLFLDIRHIKRQNFLLILIWLILIEIIVFWILWRLNTRIILAIITFNWSLWALFFSLEMVDFNSIWYFSNWWYIFTLFITITYSIAFVWMFQEFPFTCQWLNEASNKLYNFIEKPFYIFKSKWENWKQRWTKLWETLNSIWELEITSNNWENTANPIILKFNEFKKWTIDQIMADTSEYNDWVCDFLLSDINEKFWKSNLKRSVIILSYLLLYWFIRIAFLIMSGIAFILFRILYRSKIYKIKQISKKVDEIY